MKIEEHKQLVLDIIEGVKSGEIGKVTTALSTISEDYAKINALNESLTKEKSTLDTQLKKLKEDNLDLYIKLSGLENKNPPEDKKPPIEEHEKTEDEIFAELQNEDGTFK